MRTGLFLAFAGTGVGVTIVALVLARRFRLLLTSALAAAAVIVVLAGLNRLLQPTSTAYCGSVLNRHRTYDAGIEARCDALLRPAKRAAAAAFAAAAVLGASTMVFARQAAQSRVASKKGKT